MQMEVWMGTMGAAVRQWLWKTRLMWRIMSGTKACGLCCTGGGAAPSEGCSQATYTRMACCTAWCSLSGARRASPRHCITHCTWNGVGSGCGCCLLVVMVAR